MSDPVFRAALPSDREFAFQVRKAAFREYVELCEGWDEVEQRRRHEERFDGQEVRVLQVDGEEVGIVALLIEGDCLKVNQFFLLPEHQGRGIGGGVMALLLDEARDLGLPVRLGVRKVNPRARAFYARLGFVRTGESDTHDWMERRS